MQSKFATNPKITLSCVALHPAASSFTIIYDQGSFYASFFKNKLHLDGHFLSRKSLVEKNALRSSSLTAISLRLSLFFSLTSA